MNGIDNTRAILGEARANMALSAAKARRRSPVHREAVTAPALPALPASATMTMTKAEPQRQPQVNVDLTGIPAFTAEMLSAHTGVSMRSVREAIRIKKIRVIRLKGQPGRLSVVCTLKWLQAKHGIAPMALLDIYLQES